MAVVCSFIVKEGKVTICKHKQVSSLSNEQIVANMVSNSGSMLPQTSKSILILQTQMNK